MHLNASLHSSKDGDQGPLKKFKPHLGSLLSPNDERSFDELLLLLAKKDLLSEVGDAINDYDSLFDPTGIHSWYLRSGKTLLVCANGT